jgi:N-acyl homoserine lactone hydrolase
MAANELYLLYCGRLFGEAQGTSWQSQIPAYLIRSSSGKHYLVDTGNPTALIGAPDCRPWYAARCDFRPEDDPISRLAELGLGADDIDAIIATHFDFDHIGRNDAFGPLGTDVLVQRAHLGAALSDPDRYDPALWNVPGLRWHSLDGDHDVEPGIRLLRTDGHATGHQSLMVETDSGWVILAVDAIDGVNALEKREFPDYWDDPGAANRSIDRLLALSSEFDAPIIMGHEFNQWETLPHSPQPYRRD